MLEDLHVTFIQPGTDFLNIILYTLVGTELQALNKPPQMQQKPDPRRLGSA